MAGAEGQQPGGGAPAGASVPARTAEAERLRPYGEEFYRLVVENAREFAILTIDVEGRILTWNPGAERIMGWTEQEVLGERIELFFTPEDRARGLHEKEIREAIEEGQSEDDRWHLRKDGSRFWGHGTLMSLRDGNGEVRALAKILRDLTGARMLEEQRQQWTETLEARVAERTAELEAANQRLVAEIEERKRLEAESLETEERLRQAQKMEAVGQLTGGVAHDFNNLLTAIMGNLETLRRNMPEGNERLKRSAENAMEAAARAATLTRRLLVFSRRQPLEPRAAELNELITGMLDLVRRSLGEDVGIELDLAGDLWPVEVDPNQLENAILNLAVNARDAMPEGGRLILRTRNTVLDRPREASRLDLAPGDYVAVSVVDTGIGMPEEVAARAFEPFFTTKGPVHGTGLGLSQVYGFVKQSGGHVRIDSKTGRGTAVTMILPRYTAGLEEGRAASAQPAAPAAPAPAPSSEPGPRRGGTVLVVEDDPAVREYSVDALQELGYEVLAAADGNSALGLLVSGPRIDLLFTDVRLPGMDGPEIAEKARRLVPGLKILFATGYAESGIAREGRLDPGVHVLNKPFTFTELAAKVKDVIEGGSGRRRILVVEDEPLVRIVAVDSLTALGFEVEEAATAAEAREKLAREGPGFDAALIDVGLPDIRGDALVPEVRARYPELRIVVATGYAEADLAGWFASDSQTGFLEKPYGPERLSAALRRVGIAPPDA